MRPVVKDSTALATRGRRSATACARFEGVGLLACELVLCVRAVPVIKSIEYTSHPSHTAHSGVSSHTYHYHYTLTQTIHSLLAIEHRSAARLQARAGATDREINRAILTQLTRAAAARHTAEPLQPCGSRRREPTWRRTTQKPQYPGPAYDTQSARRCPRAHRIRHKRDAQHQGEVSTPR